MPAKPSLAAGFRNRSARREDLGVEQPAGAALLGWHELRPVVHVAMAEVHGTFPPDRNRVTFRIPGPASNANPLYMEARSHTLT